MPEGPSIVILKDEATRLVGRRIVAVEGNTQIDKERLVGERIVALRSWGKHFLVELPTFALRVHFLMFGSYRIDERKDAAPRLGLRFADGGEFNLYTCSVRFIDEPLDESTTGAPTSCRTAGTRRPRGRSCARCPTALVCDALLDQNVFAGVGNIIKNEVLFRIRLHPLSTIGALPPRKLRPARRRGAPLQLRLPRMEAGVRAAASTGSRTPSGPARAARFRSSRRISAGPTGAASSASAASGATAADVGRAAAGRLRRRRGAPCNPARIAGTSSAAPPPITSLSPRAPCVPAPHEKSQSHRSDRRPGAARRHVRPSRHRLDVAPVSAQQLSHHDARRSWRRSARSACARCAGARSRAT